MLTPNGRFEANKEICLTNSRFHKGEWTSSWNIVSILIAFYSVFSDDFDNGVAHIKKSKEERSLLANDSIEYNNKNFSNIYNKFNRTHLKDEP
jgi:ubiquitin-conjugating enzyme E2 J1